MKTKNIKQKISSNEIVQKTQKHNLITGTYFHGQNDEKLKNDKIVIPGWPAAREFLESFLNCKWFLKNP